MRMEIFMNKKGKNRNVGNILKKYRLSTTISMQHWAILKKLAEQYETQQKVLELALERLNNPGQGCPLTRDEELWMLLGKVKSVCAIQKDGLRVLIDTMDTDHWAEYVNQQKPLQFVTEVYLQKPLGECSLNEILDALIVNSGVSKQFDTINYTDDGGHFTLKMTHDLGLNNSKMLKILHESLFNSYGAKSEYLISERSIFIKIYKT
jgi:hypothetical protein